MNPAINKHNILKSIFSAIGWLDFVVCLILAFLFTAAPHYIREDSFVISAGVLWTMLFYYLGFLLAAFIARRLLLGFGGRRSSWRILSCFRRILDHRYAVLLLSLIMFLCWLPLLITFYPGTAINDTWNQLQQFMRVFRDGRVYLEFLYDHHPIVDTWIMGQIIIPLVKLTGDWHLAFFIYVLLQSFITCLAFSFLIRYIDRKMKLGTGIVMAIFLFYCLLPIFPASAQTICKDALFSWIYIFFCIHFMELVRTKGAFMDQTGNRDLLLATALACCLTKKVGFYVVIVSLLFAVFAFRKGRRQILTVLLVCLIFMKILLPALMAAAHIGSGGKQEMLSLPFQMTARYVKYHPDDIEEDEYEVLDKVLDMDGLADRYIPSNADPVKRFTQMGETKDYLAYMSVWARQGFRHPGTYWDGLLAMEAGWFSWTRYFPLTNMDWHIQLNSQMIPETAAVRPEPFAGWTESFLNRLDKVCRIPFIALFFSYGFYAAILPAFTLCTLIRISKRDRNYSWIAVLPAFFSLALGCWLAPVSIHFEGLRYLYPLVYTAPLNIAWCRYQSLSSAHKSPLQQRGEEL